MTEATTEQKTHGLLRHAFYNHGAMVLFATDEERLIAPNSFDNYVTPNSETSLLEVPGTPDWIDRMVRVRNTLAMTEQNLQHQHDNHLDHWQRFGEACLEKAEEMSWCDEYEIFAEEWGLPSRVAEFDVTVSVRVSARNEEEAAEIVANGVNLESYRTDGVVSGPDFDVNPAH